MSRWWQVRVGGGRFPVGDVPDGGVAMFVKVAVLAVLAVLAAGCGGDSGNTAGGGDAVCAADDIWIHNRSDLASFIEANCEEVAGSIEISEVDGRNLSTRMRRSISAFTEASPLWQRAG